MKVLIALFALVAIANADWTIQTQEDLIKYRNECVEQLNVPADYVEKFKKWTFPDDVTTHSYINCILPKLGLFDAEHGFNVEHLVQQLGQNRDQAEVRADVLKCVDSNEQGTDQSSWAFRGFKCFLDSHLQLVQNWLYVEGHEGPDEPNSGTILIRMKISVHFLTGCFLFYGSKIVANVNITLHCK